MYNEFGKKNKGYSEKDIIKICEDVAGISLADFFKKYVYGTEDFEPMLIQCFEYVGLEMKKQPSQFKSESDFGFKIAEQAHISKVTLVAPFSPAWKAGLSIGDEVMSVNSIDVKNDLNNWLKYFSNSEIALTISSQGKVKTLVMKSKDGVSYFENRKIVFKESTSAEQKTNYSKWLSEN